MLNIFSIFSCLLMTISSFAIAETKPSQTLEPQVAGRFYPADKTALRDRINLFFKKVPEQEFNGRPIAIISPHAGYVYSGQVASHSFQAIRNHGFKRAIVLAPNHSGRRFRGASILKVKSFKTPLGEIPVDQEACERLLDTTFKPVSKNSYNKDKPLRLFGEYRGAYKGEHSLETQLPFLQMVLGDFDLVPVMIGVLIENDFDLIANALKPLLDNETLVVVSSDFTHYGQAYRYVPFTEKIEENIRELDYGAFEKILNKDFEGLRLYRKQTGINACGVIPIAVLLKLLPDDAKGHILSYNTSGHQTNNFTYSVSYASILFTRSKEDGIKSGKVIQEDKHAVPLTQKEKKFLLSLARNTLKIYTTTGSHPDLKSSSDIPTPKLQHKYGVFVTLKKEGRLRGCIGYILPKSPLYQAVIENTINSSSRDNRFTPVKAKEIDNITIEISVLSLPRRISGPDEFVVGEEGIIIRKGHASAVFLPHVATEQGWDREETLCHLCKKAGLSENAWKEDEMEFYVFTADVFHETGKTQT